MFISENCIEMYPLRFLCLHNLLVANNMWEILGSVETGGVGVVQKTMIVMIE